MRLQGDCLKVGSVWLFGMFPRRFQWSGTQMFTCLDHDCHSDQSSGCACCSSLPKDGYALTFDYRGKRISVFAHASEEAKKWLCGRLNERLLAANGSACSAEEQSCSCTHQ